MKIFGLKVTRKQMIALAVTTIIGIFFGTMMVITSSSESLFIRIFCIAFGVFAVGVFFALPFSTMVAAKKMRIERNREMQISKGLIKFNTFDFDSIDYYIDHMEIIADGKLRKFYYYHLIFAKSLVLNEESFKKYTGKNV